MVLQKFYKILHMNMCSQISKLWVHGYNEFLSTTCLCVNGFVSNSALGLKNMAIISKVVLKPP